MWGRRNKRRTRLEKQLSLALLEDALARAEQQADAPGPEEAVPEGAVPEEAAPAERVPGRGPVPAPGPAGPAGLQPADVPVDNSSGPSAADPVPPKQRQRPAARREESTRHGSLG